MSQYCLMCSGSGKDDRTSLKCSCQQILYTGLTLDSPVRPGSAIFIKPIEHRVSIPISLVMEIYKELSYLTDAASNANLAERLLKLVKGENNG